MPDPPSVVAVIVLVTAACALVVSLVALALVLRSTPLKLLGRQSDLESQMETTLRGCLRLETAWTQFLADREELEESIREQLQRVNQKNRAVAAREARLQQHDEHGQGNGAAESLEEFERRMMRSARG